MPPPTPSRLYDVCAALLTAVVDGYESVPVPLPARRYVSDGPMAAWDCDQFAVYCENTFPGLSDLEQASAQDHAGVRSARIWLEVVRPSPTFDAPEGYAGNVTPPTAEAIDANAQLVLADAIMLPWCVHQGKRDGLLGTCNGVTLDNWQGLGPMGSYVGGRFGVRIQLDGL